MKFALLFLLLSTAGWAKWTVTTYNIRNFDNDSSEGRTDLKELARILKDVQSDVMAFEEVVNKSAFDDLIKKNLPGYKYNLSNCGGFGKQHLAVVYNPNTFEYVRHYEDLNFSGSGKKCESLRPAFFVTLKHKETKTDYIFGVVHLKAGGSKKAMEQRWQQYEKLRGVSFKHEKDNLILLGDFNTTGYNIKDADYVKFEDFISASSLRTMSEEIGCTNYWSGTQGGKEFRPSILDHIVVQDKLVSSVESVKVGAHCEAMSCRPAAPEVLGVSFQSVSDHCPVQVTFR